MVDLIYLVVIVAFFASCWLLIALCDRLGGERP